MQRAGLALSGILTLSAASKSGASKSGASKSGASKSTSEGAVRASKHASQPDPFRRIRPARGAVQRKV